MSHSSLWPSVQSAWVHRRCCSPYCPRLGQSSTWRTYLEWPWLPSCRLHCCASIAALAVFSSAFPFSLHQGTVEPPAGFCSFPWLHSRTLEKCPLVDTNKWCFCAACRRSLCPGFHWGRFTLLSLWAVCFLMVTSPCYPGVATPVRGKHRSS